MCHHFPRSGLSHDMQARAAGPWPASPQRGRVVATVAAHQAGAGPQAKLLRVESEGILTTTPWRFLWPSPFIDEETEPRVQGQMARK